MAEYPVNTALVPELEAAVRADSYDYSCESDRCLENDELDCIVLSHSEVDGDKGLSSQTRTKSRHSSRRHKGGSRHKHKRYRPHSVTEGDLVKFKEKSRKIQEKELAAALVRHEVGQRVTYPVAPFNSTQFLMDEQNESLPPSLDGWCSPHSLTSTPETVHESAMFETNDEFSDYFSSVYAENLYNLSKADLVRHYISLEEKIRELRKQVALKESHLAHNNSLRAGIYYESECVFDSNSDLNSFSGVMKNLLISPSFSSQL